MITGFNKQNNRYYAQLIIDIKRNSGFISERFL